MLIFHLRKYIFVNYIRDFRKISCWFSYSSLIKHGDNPNLLKNTWHSRDTESLVSIREEVSIWRTRSLYWRFFSFSFLSKYFFSSDTYTSELNSLKTLMSKNTFLLSRSRKRFYRDVPLVLCWPFVCLALPHWLPHECWFCSYVMTDLFQ